MPFDGFLEGLEKADSISESQAYLDAVSTLDSILPDNANFTSDDATLWETRLGLITNLMTPLSDRMLAIKNKLNQPGPNPAKQAASYLQEQLNNAGFNVFVFENRFSDGMGGFITQTPEQVSGLTNLTTASQFNQRQFGEVQFGGNYNNTLINFIDETQDLPFNFDGNYRNTFFICGSPVGSVANVLHTRHDEFRQLILRTKPVQTIAFLFINYN